MVMNSPSETQKAFNEITNLSSGTRRQVADGRRWPGLPLIAQVEEAFKDDATGYSVALQREDRARPSATH